MGKQTRLIRDRLDERLDRLLGKGVVDVPSWIPRLARLRDLTPEEDEIIRRAGWLKILRDFLKRTNRETLLPRYGKLQGTQLHLRLERMDFEQLEGWCQELAVRHRRNFRSLARIVAYVVDRFNRRPALPTWAWDMMADHDAQEGGNTDG